MFVFNLRYMVQEGLSEVLEPLGRYERLVMRMSPIFFTFSNSWPYKWAYYYRSLLKIRIFHIFERGSCRANIEYSPTGSYHLPGANPTH
jgi:hypothetical protein